MITRVQVKKSLLKNVGNAKQCLLCSRVFSRERMAVEHVFGDHGDLLRSPGDTAIGTLAERGDIDTPDTNKLSEPTADTKVDTGGCRWMCKFCSTIFRFKEDTVTHFKEIHGINRAAARDKSLRIVR